MVDNLLFCSATDHTDHVFQQPDAGHVEKRHIVDHVAALAEDKRCCHACVYTHGYQYIYASAPSGALFIRLGNVLYKKHIYGQYSDDDHCRKGVDIKQGIALCHGIYDTV